VEKTTRSKMSSTYEAHQANDPRGSNFTGRTMTMKICGQTAATEMTEVLAMDAH